MAKRKVYVIAGERFPARKGLQERIRKILHSYQEDENLSGPDECFMKEVLSLHPSKEVKIGCGVKSLCIKTNPVYPSTRCFWIRRDDGSETDFSYLECLNETSHQKRFERACRAAIEPYTMAFKRAFFERADGTSCRCPYTGELLRLVGSHVDHEAPLTFQKLVSIFIKEREVNIDEVKIKGKSEDNMFQDAFEDLDLKRAWVDYHNAHATLQVVSKSANLSQLKRNGKKP